MQRDLSGSTVIRNQGLALGYSVIALNNLVKGVGRITINKQKIKNELNNHWEVLAEALQTILRKNGFANAYETIKDLTRGESLNKNSIKEIISKLDVSSDDKDLLLGLSPETYTGLSSVLARLR